MKKLTKFFALFLSFLLVMSTLGGCSGNSPSSSAPSSTSASASAAAKETATGSAYAGKVLGDHLKYDTTKLVNDGKPITINMWYQVAYQAFMDKWTKEYIKIHPNVAFNIIYSSHADLFAKLPIALQSGTGPDVFYIHNAFTKVLVPNTEPYPFSLDEMEADYRQVANHLIDGKIYYIDWGIMTSGMFYNKKMWADAGLTDNDIPKTWDQLIVVAKKLTKFDAAGNMTVSGFNFNTVMGALLMALSYQSGNFMFKADDTADLNNDVWKKNVHLLVDMFKVDKICDVAMPKSHEALAKGVSAIVYNWSWVASYFKTSAPGLDFGVFPLPTFDGKEPPAYDRNNGDSTPGVNARTSAEKKAVGFDFIKFMLCCDDAILDFTVSSGDAAAKYSLDSNNILASDPLLKVECAVVGRTIYPGIMPGVYGSALTAQIEQDILLNGVSVEAALKSAEETINKDPGVVGGFDNLERLYKYANLFKN